MNDELLPCPFCGERPVLLRDGTTAAHACSALDIELRVPRRVWNHRYRGICSVPVRHCPNCGVRVEAMHEPDMDR